MPGLHKRKGFFVLKQKYAIIKLWKNSAMLKRKLKWVLLSILSLIIDAIFLVFWGVIQYLIDWVFTNHIELQDLNKDLLPIYKIVFALATLIPVIASTLLDIILIIKKYVKIINED